MTLSKVKNPVWRVAIIQTEDQYLKAIEGLNAPLSFQAEQVFAINTCLQNDYLAEMAIKNKESMQMALLTSAALGLTLNPAEKLAYLVPRDKKVVLDISARGLIKIAVGQGAILWAKSELVFLKDSFEYLGPGEKPIHKFNPFTEDRGEFIGVYCLAKMPDTGWLVDAMPAHDVWLARDCSLAWVKGEKGKKGPWETWPNEMIKKTSLKRASKSWPASGGRLNQAIHYLNTEAGEGIIIDAAAQQPQNSLPPGDPEKADPKLHSHMKTLIARAERSGMWAAATQYIEERFGKNPDNLAYAKAALEAAKPVDG